VDLAHCVFSARVYTSEYAEARLHSPSGGMGDTVGLHTCVKRRPAMDQQETKKPWN
jgi:hypothetical protein